MANHDPNVRHMNCRTSSQMRSGNNGVPVFPAPTNRNALLASMSATLRKRPVYAYIVTTIITTPDFQLCQKGSGPNFDGGRITLCTCKHKDRATFHISKDPDDPWKHVWVAGLTSKSEDPSRALAYLMCVKRSFLNQVQLWRYLSRGCRQAKSASRSKLGDLFEPKSSAINDPYNPAHYHSPIAGHVHSKSEYPNAWHEDVMGWGKRSVPHRLLLSQVNQSYRWMQAKMILKPNAMGGSAHHRIYTSLTEFIANLEEFAP